MLNTRGFIVKLSPMENETLIRYRQQILELASKRGVQSVSVFGSYATGKINKDSDIDPLVEPKPKCSLIDLISLKYDIEDLTGKKVDIVSRKGLSPFIADKILKEAISL